MSNVSEKVDLRRGVVTRFVTREVPKYVTKYNTRYRTVYNTRYVTRVRSVITAIVTRWWLNGKVYTTIRVPTRIVVGEKAEGYAGPVAQKLFGGGGGAGAGGRKVGVPEHSPEEKFEGGGGKVFSTPVIKITKPTA